MPGTLSGTFSGNFENAPPCAKGEEGSNQYQLGTTDTYEAIAPLAHLWARHNFEELPERFALAMALHVVLEKHEPEIRAYAQRFLNQMQSMRTVG